MAPDAVERLLHELCVDLGFCLHEDAYDQLADRPPADPDEFTRAVFEAEGLEFASDERSGLKAAVRAVFLRHLEAEKMRKG